MSGCAASKPWQFSQFKVLDIVFRFIAANLKQSDVAAGALTHPKQFTLSLKSCIRADGADATTAKPSNKLILASWSGDYEGGRSPSDWADTADILRGWNATHEQVGQFIRALAICMFCWLSLTLGLSTQPFPIRVHIPTRFTYPLRRPTMRALRHLNEASRLAVHRRMHSAGCFLQL